MAGKIVLIGGPAGAGKSTLAAAWCATQDRAVHIELDDIRDLIVAGRADPQGAGEMVGEQYDLSVEACVRLAATFAAAGYDVAIDDVLEPSAFERVWAPALSGIPYTLLILMPELDEVLRRARSREKRVREDIIRAQYEASKAWSPQLTMDTTGVSVEEALAFALRERLLP